MSFYLLFFFSMATRKFKITHMTFMTFPLDSTIQHDPHWLIHFSLQLSYSWLCPSRQLGRKMVWVPLGVHGCIPNFIPWALLLQWASCSPLGALKPWLCSLRNKSVLLNSLDLYLSWIMFFTPFPYKISPFCSILYLQHAFIITELSRLGVRKEVF